MTLNLKKENTSIIVLRIKHTYR